MAQSARYIGVFELNVVGLYEDGTLYIYICRLTVGQRALRCAIISYRRLMQYMFYQLRLFAMHGDCTGYGHGWCCEPKLVCSPPSWSVLFELLFFLACFYKSVSLKTENRLHSYTSNLPSSPFC